MADDTRATLTAKALQAAIVDYYEANGLELPARRYIAVGLPAYDCELFAVSIDRIFAHSGDINIETPVATAAHPGLLMRAGTFSCTLVRCVPAPDDNGNPPPAEAEEAAALAVYADQQLMENGIIESYNAGLLVTCNGLTIVEWLPVTPSGLLGGGILRVRLSLI